MSMLGAYASYNEKDGWASWMPGHNIVGLFDRHGFSPKGVIHVGMWDFVEYECYIKLFGQNIVGIEANPNTFETKSRLVAERYDFRAYNYAAFDEDDIIVRIGNMDDQSSLFGQELYFEVKTITLDSLIERESIDMNNFDFLNIDTEGAELHVLRGIEKNLRYINYIDVEATYVPTHPDKPSYEMIIDYLFARGFREVEKSSSFGDLGWGDVLLERR